MKKVKEVYFEEYERGTAGLLYPTFILEDGSVKRPRTKFAGQWYLIWLTDEENEKHNSDYSPKARPKSQQRKNWFEKMFSN